MSEVLPCPFCGECCQELVSDIKWAGYAPTCLEVRTGYDDSELAPWRAEAIAAWNTRAALSRPADHAEPQAMTDLKETLARDVAREVIASRKLQRDNGLVYGAALEAATIALARANQLRPVPSVEVIARAVFFCHFASSADAQSMMDKEWGKPSPLMDMVQREATAIHNLLSGEA